MYRYLYEHVVYPLYHLVLNDGASQAIRALRQNQHLSAGELRQLEGRKLKALLDHAVAQVPYYRQIVKERAIVLSTASARESLSQFPILTKEAIRAETGSMVSADLDGNRIDSNSTSGSSGSPLSFFTDRRSKAFRKATVIRNREWLGIRLGDPVAHLWGSPIDQQRAASLRGNLHSWLTRESMLDAYQLSDSDLVTYARTLARKRVRLLVGYPSVLVRFAAFCRDEGYRFPTLRAVISSAETLYPHQSQAIQEDLGVPVYNRYGCREVGDIAHEIPGCDGLVVNSDRIVVEVLDEEGNACPPGTQGEIVVTDLDNYGMPLIRYRIGDLGIWQDAELSRARMAFPILESVDGRSLDVVVAPNGNRLGGTFWTILLRTRPGIDMFQVVQNESDNITIRVVPDQNGENIDEDYFRTEIAKKCGENLDVSFKYERNIEAESNGKYRVVISSIH